MPNTLHGHVLITGAVGGLGTAMVQRLLQEGHTIIACDRNTDAAGEWLERLPAEHQNRVQFHPLDVTKEDQVDALANALREQGVHVAYLINNAGIFGAGTESRVWERTLRVNIHGTFYMTRAFSQAMVAQRTSPLLCGESGRYRLHPLNRSRPGPAWGDRQRAGSRPDSARRLESDIFRC